MHALPTERALKVHAEPNVCDAVITQRPTAAVTTHKVRVTALFTTYFYHRESPRTWQSTSRAETIQYRDGTTRSLVHPWVVTANDC
jgi:hypothetical protein